MSLTEETEDDKIEIVGPFKIICVRTAHIIKRDGTEISRAFSSRCIPPDISSGELSNESEDLKAIVAQLHTDEIKTAYSAHVEETTP